MIGSLGSGFISENGEADEIDFFIFFVSFFGGGGGEQPIWFLLELTISVS